MVHEEEFKADYASGQLVFFAGAGASVDSQAPLPDAILRASAKAFLPADEQDRIEEVLKHNPAPHASFRGIQPEIFYEHLLNICGEQEALFLWRVLSPAWLARNGVEMRPNPNHLALARYAAKTGLPIFTTNFDTLFEQAAQKALGIKAEVVTPALTTGRTLEELCMAPTRPGGVTIVKLHGSIAIDGRETLSSLHSTMKSITATNARALDLLAKVSSGRAMAFLGYSGCDLDYFPAFTNGKPDLPPYWFNPMGDKITAGHLSLVQAREITRKPAELFATLNPADALPKRSIALAQDTLLARLLAEQQVRLSEPRQRLLLAMCLGSVGLTQDGAEILIELRESSAFRDNPRDEALMLLHLARFEDALSRYEDSIADARRAEAAVSCGAKSRSIPSAEAQALRILALYQRSMSSQQMVGPNLLYGDPRVDFRPPLLAMLTKLLVGFWVETRFWLARRRPALRYSKGAPSSIVRARHAMNDHWGMMLSRINGFLMGSIAGRAPGARSLLRYWLEALKARTGKDGDYFAYAGAEKLLERMAGLTASDAYLMLRDPLNYALILRDRGAIALKGNDLEKAIADFSAARDAARACGSAATLVKAIAGLVVCGADTSQDRIWLEQALRTLQGAGYQAYARKLAMTLRG